jgi:lipoic acid synthetase
MIDLLGAGCSILSLGQYLQPSKKQISVEEFIEPERFEAYRIMGQELGFRFVASGPLVRSSYKAAEVFAQSHLDKKQAAAWEV